MDYIVGRVVGLNVFISRNMCRGGGTIGARVRLERGAQGSFKTSVYFSIVMMHLKLHS